MIDLNDCIIAQINSKEDEPQKVVDMIFKAKDYRMKGFSGVEFVDFENDMYRPLEGMTKNERSYCLNYSGLVEQNLNTVSYKEHIKESFDRTSRKLNLMIQEIKSK